MVSENSRVDKLDAVLKKINSDKRFKTDNNSNIISKLSDKPLDVEKVSSGSLVLDDLLGGGIAKGRVIEIYGAESSGKTSIALTTVGNIQKEGGTAVFIDVENALDPKYARVLGVNTDELAVSQPNNAEQALDLLQELTETGVVDIIVLDSVAALVPTAELEGDTGDQTIGLLARIMSKSLKKLISSANRTGTTILMINQTRTDIGKFSPFGTPTTTSGGKALKFYASQRIEIKKGQQVKSDDAGSKNKIIGNEVKFKIVKNKIAPPFATGDSILTFNQGINKAADMLKIAPIYGVIERPNARTYVDAETGEPFAKSKAEALEVLEKDTELFNKLQTALLDKINNPDDHGNKDDSTVSDTKETVDDEDDDFDIDDE